MIGLSNKTVINRCAKLTANGFLTPHIVKERIRSYQLSDYTKERLEEIVNQLVI